MSYSIFSTVILVGLWGPDGFAQTIPPMAAKDLNGRELAIPGDLKGSPAVLIVAFEREQQPEIDRIAPFLESARASFPGLKIWEIPLVDNPGAIGRFVIDRGMRSGIASEETRASVVTLYVKDRKAWMKTAGLPEMQTVYVVALTNDGRVAGFKTAASVTGVKDVEDLLRPVPATKNSG